MTAVPAEFGLTQEQLQGMLQSFLSSTDNTERRRVESTVVNSLDAPCNLMLLVRVLRDVQGVSAGVRQLAAVLLRKKIFSLWHAIPAELRAELKGVLLAQLGLEPVRIVRFAVAHLVTRLAKADALEADGGWPELEAAIRAAVEDPRGDVRELAMVVAYGIAEVVGERSGGGFSAMVVEAVLHGMADAEVSVQRAAVKAMGSLLLFVNEDDDDDAAVAARKKQEHEQLIQGLIPHCLQLLAMYGAAEERTSVCADVLDLLVQLVEELKVKRHGELLRTLGLEMISLLVNKAIRPRVRQNSVEVLETLVNLKPKFVTQTLLEPMVAACVQVMGEDNTISLPELAHVDDSGDDHNNDNDDDDDAMVHVNPPCMYAGSLLTALVEKVPAKSFTNALLPFVARVSENRQAGPLERKAAILSLSFLAEGNPGFLRRRIQYVLKLAHEFLSDSDPVPREATAFALTYFCIHLQPEILTYHQQLFPMLVPLLRDDHDGVRQRVAGALDTICENVAEDVEPYVPLVLPAVLDAIGCSSLETQRALCGVIASLASTRSPSFRLHAAQCLELLKTPLTITSPETILLRAKAIDTVGIVANAIGREAFMPFLPFFIDRVAENLRTRQAELREETFGFLSNLCETLRGDFMPYLDESIECALQTIREDRVHYQNKHLLAEGRMRNINLGSGNENNNKEGDGHDDHDDDDDSDAEEIHARVRTADMEEKSSAIYFIGVCADVLLGDFGSSRIDACWSELTDLDVHFHTSIRSNALIALAKLTKAAQGSGSVVKSLSEDTLNPYARQLLKTFINDSLFTCIHMEMDKEVVASACEAFELLFNYFGPQIFIEDMTIFLETVVKLLQQETSCQHCDDEDDDDDDDDREKNTQNGSQPKTMNLGEDHDSVLIDTVCDMIDACAKAYGPAFRNYSDTVLPALLPYTSDDRPSEDVVMATGSIATIIEAMGAASEPYVDDGVALALRLIGTTDESATKANCAYLLRALVECCPGRFDSPAATAPLLRALGDIAGSREEIPEAVDNAVSATCTMVRCLSPGAVPLPLVVPTLLERIPMRVDRQENGNAIRTLVYLLSCQREITRSEFWMAIIRCVASVLAALTVDDEQKQMLVVQGVIPFTEDCRNEWREACAQLPGELRAAMERYGCC